MPGEKTNHFWSNNTMEKYLYHGQVFASTKNLSWKSKVSDIIRKSAFSSCDFHQMMQVDILKLVWAENFDMSS